MSEGYRETLAFLYDELPQFSRQGKSALKHDLKNITRLCEALGHPETAFPAIHIAGTNGKGSTSHALAAILQHAGYKTGLYTSPHLVDFRERIRINGQPVGEEWVVDFVRKHRNLIDETAPSFFELTVAMAFSAFATYKADIAVIETGLGGRLDSTNIITPLLSVITNISYDHQDVLGSTLPEIAAEKAGIIKPGIPVLIGEPQPETERVFLEKAFQKQSTIYYAPSLWELVTVPGPGATRHFKAVHKAHRDIYDLHTDLRGAYQQHNIKTVLAATEILAVHHGLKLTIPAAIEALASVTTATGLRGRWEICSHNPAIFVDVAHNEAGIRETMRQWEEVKAERKFILCGFVQDKDTSAVLPYFPTGQAIYCCQANILRALAADELTAQMTAAGRQAIQGAGVEDSLRQILNKMQPGDALLITGSFFIAGEAISFLETSLQKDKKESACTESPSSQE